MSYSPTPSPSETVPCTDCGKRIAATRDDFLDLCDDCTISRGSCCCEPN